MFRKSLRVLCIAVTGLCSYFEQGISKEIVFSWHKNDSPISSSEIERRVVFSLLQENIRHKVEATLLELEIPYTLQVEKQFLPSQFSISFDDFNTEKIESLKMFSQEKYTYFLENTAFLEELDHIKDAWQDWTQKQKTLCLASNNAEFLEDLENILLKVSPQDLIDQLQSEVQYENPELAAFLALPLTDEYREKIRSFITDFASKSMSQLVIERTSMEARKEELVAVHPLRHIAFVWLDLNLHQPMKSIKKSSFKWTRYLKGMTRALKRHKLAGTLDEYVPGFADFLKADRDTVQSYLYKENYRGLFEYLFKLEILRASD